MYKIFVDGKAALLEKIRVSAHPFNRVWPGKQRDEKQSEEAYMIRLFGEGKKKIEIEVSEKIDTAVIRPLSQNVQIKKEKHKIAFVLAENGKYSVEINGTHYAIHLFYQQCINYSAFKKPTYCFKEGHHYVGMIKLKSGDSVCVERGAIVHGSLFAVNAENIEIYGEGVLCGDWEERTEKHGDIGFDNENNFIAEKVHTYGGIRMYKCKKIYIKGITVTDTASYAISFFATEGIYIDDVNVVGIWKYNCDGIDFFNSSNIEVKNCFIRSFDDSMCMKGLTAFSDKNTENAHVEKCVFWCDWGKNIDIGLATACKEIKNITWQDCDIIHNSITCIAISAGQWADVNNITYKDIRIEYVESTEKPMLQCFDDQEYENGNTIPELIRFSDKRRTWQGNISSEDEKPSIRNITIEGIAIFAEQGIRKLPEIIIEKTIKNSTVKNIQLKDFSFNGNVIDVSGFCLK